MTIILHLMTVIWNIYPQISNNTLTRFLKLCNVSMNLSNVNKSVSLVHNARTANTYPGENKMTWKHFSKS